MVWVVVCGVVALWAALYLIPDVIWHHLQWGALMGKRDGHQIALTFDDGPGPDTARILEALREQGARATFFVIAERARHYPEELKIMVRDGHEIALHGNQHRSMYLFWPWAVKQQLQDGLAVIREITGVEPTAYRPPWGHHNLMTKIFAARLGLRRVLWSVAPDDWKPGKTAIQIDRYVSQLSQPGAIVVMHDAGGDRKQTVEALKLVVPHVRALGMEPVRVSDLLVEKSEIRRWWTWWETKFTKNWDIDTIPSSLGGDPVLRLGLIRFPFHPVILSDGHRVNRKDLMGEMHFGNPALSQLSGSRAGGLRAFHAVLRSLIDLAKFVSENDKYHDISVIGGITLLDASSAIDKLGFDRISVSGRRKWSMWFYLIFLMAIYHSDGWSTLKRFMRLHPVLLIMDRETLIKKYLRAPSKQQA